MFRCPACGDPADLSTLPLCAPCSDVLTPAPPLCLQCASPGCGESCFRPWIQNPDIQGFHALYLSTPGVYRVLKAWKKSRGMTFHRRILRPSPRLIQDLRNARLDGIVPVPQNWERAWRLLGSPTELLAKQFSEILEIPIFSVLEAPEAGATRQAEKKFYERSESAPAWKIKTDSHHPLRNKNILIVDDFMTTGKTLASVAHELRIRGGARVIHTLCLGVRPPRQPEIHHSKSGSDSESIGQEHNTSVRNEFGRFLS